MHRLALEGSLDQQLFLTPDRTVLEAAEALERRHAHHLIVSENQTPVGVLTAADIMNKVLAAGRDPNVVHVADIMAAGRFDRHGRFLVDDDTETATAIFGAETLHSRDDDDPQVLLEVLRGKCEECGVFNEELVDHEGLQMCGDCSGLRAALFG